MKESDKIIGELCEAINPECDGMVEAVDLEMRKQYQLVQLKFNCDLDASGSIGTYLFLKNVRARLVENKLQHLQRVLGERDE